MGGQGKCLDGEGEGGGVGTARTAAGAAHAVPRATSAVRAGATLAAVHVMRSATASAARSASQPPGRWELLDAPAGTGRSATSRPATSGTSGGGGGGSGYFQDAAMAAAAAGADPANGCDEGESLDTWVRRMKVRVELLTGKPKS